MFGTRVREGRAGCPQGGRRGYRPARPPPRRLSFRARVAQFARASPRHCYTLDSQLESIIMLIGLVRDSVMQCFCHSCRAPVLPAGWKRVFYEPAFYVGRNIGDADTTIAAETNHLTFQYSLQYSGKNMTSLTLFQVTYILITYWLPILLQGIPVWDLGTTLYKFFFYVFCSKVLFIIYYYYFYF